MPFAKKCESLTESKRSYMLLQSRPQGTIPCKHEFRFRMFSHNQCRYPNESRVVLCQIVHARDHSDPHYTRLAGQRRVDLYKSGLRKPVRNHSQLFFRQATTIAQIVRSSAGITHHPVAKLKRRALHPKSRPAHQISQLAVASNDHWHTGETRRGNEHQVRIEVEGMRQSCVMVLQISA